MTRQDVIELIARHACEVMPNLASHAFQPADRLEDLGANSVDRAEIAMLTLESLSLSIPRVEMFGPRNIGELAELLHRKLHGV